jgi:hypothetical protein
VEMRIEGGMKTGKPNMWEANNREEKL